MSWAIGLGLLTHFQSMPWKIDWLGLAIAVPVDVVEDWLGLAEAFPVDFVGD